MKMEMEVDEYSYDERRKGIKENEKIYQMKYTYVSKINKIEPLLALHECLNQICLKEHFKHI